ncbi:TetR family transcriptional regulator C-terminal domain-containing protein [Flavobacterium lindanitolerans]|uniref:TetR family transcriptional regulator C-terminal domain-containing protein n=1 Tax=Flavobacterium lindanitolerans TaxID=428988 RepID=UPI002809D58C|nr:TetR family transcriptional regulator C-terminal domain-containing protein [Flavobacterium lindanitolerans]MDQ7962316.1 TetR family transcriptional regulator C-terminal domain-containing protein [Flavobacterium lindanitolerans]
MATAKNSKSKKQLIDDDQLIEMYMNTVLEKNEAPKNVYLFCKENTVEEADFYSFFNSLDTLKETIWVKFFENTVSTLHKDANYAGYENRNKLLSLYFTFFEILTLNRTYVYYALKDNKEGLRNLKQLVSLRNHFKDYIVDILKYAETEKDSKIKKVTTPLFSEGAWLQFLFILKFWLDDRSKGFEKTDIMIEKAVKATFDVLDTTPLESLFDLGKFIWKERV